MATVDATPAGRLSAASGRRGPGQEALGVFRGELRAHPRPQRIGAESRRSALKSPSRRRQAHSMPASRAFAHRLAAAKPPARVVVAGDVETAKRRGQDQGGEVVGRERRDHRQGREDAAERQHGLDALARRQHVVGAPKRTPCPSRWPMARRGVAIGALSSRVAGEPGALHAGDRAAEVGDRGDQRRPGLASALSDRGGRSSAGESARMRGRGTR